MKNKFFLSCLLISMSSLAANADLITPLNITSGFNQDVIADGTSAAASTTATTDGFANFYDASYASYRGFSGGAFPAGQTVTGATTGIQYNLAPPSATGSINNDLLLAASASAYPSGAVGSTTSGTLSFTPVTSVQSIYVLGTSTNGGSTLSYQLVFAGNAQPSDATGTLSFADWGSGASGGEVTGLGRVITSNPAAFSTSGVQLYGDLIDVPLDDRSLTLTGVTFTYTSTDVPNTASIFALTAVQSVPEPSTWAMMFIGVGFLIGVRRFTRKA